MDRSHRFNAKAVSLFLLSLQLFLLKVICFVWGLEDEGLPLKHDFEEWGTADEIECRSDTELNSPG